MQRLNKSKQTKINSSTRYNLQKKKYENNIAQTNQFKIQICNQNLTKRDKQLFKLHFKRQKVILKDCNKTKKLFDKLQTKMANKMAKYANKKSLFQLLEHVKTNFSTKKTCK